ncbi:hypothetical protein ACP0HM_09785 [Escherichia coli]
MSQGDQPEIDASSNRRINIASSSPVTRARSRCFGGSFSARMAIKTGLSNAEDQFDHNQRD